MQFITTVTQKGQITLPIAFRKQLSLHPYDRVVLDLTPNKKTIRVNGTEDILDIAGTLVPRANKNMSALKAREYMENNYQRV